MSLVYSVVEKMNAVDLFVIAYAFVDVLIALFGFQMIGEWPSVIVNCLFIMIAVFLIALLRTRSNEAAIKLVQIFYIIPLVPIFFKTSEKMSYALHGMDYDRMLITADRLIFHTDPTIWLATHLPVIPAFVEYLQISYFLYYFLPIALLIEMYRRRIGRGEDIARENSTPDELEELRFVTLYGFLLSYIGYLFYPAIGPRFTLHDFQALSRDLPGLYFTDGIRAMLNAGENIRQGMSLQMIQHVVTRDAFPSGHTLVTFLTIVLAFKFRAKLRWPIFVVGTSLIFSTVYLRYHYVIDVIAGLLFAVITLYSWEYIYRGLVHLRNNVLRGSGRSTTPIPKEGF